MPPGSARTWPIGGLDQYEHDPTLTLAGGRRHPCPRRTSRPESQDALALAIDNNLNIELQRWRCPGRYRMAASQRRRFDSRPELHTFGSAYRRGIAQPGVDQRGLRGGSPPRADRSAPTRWS